MPELPEVHTISKDLDRVISGHTILDVAIFGGYNALPNNNILLKSIKGKKVTKVDRIAKNIRFHIENKSYMLIHLAMTGQVLIRDTKHKQDKFVRIIFTMENSKNETYHVKFCDMRMFGKVVIMEKHQIENFKLKYGPEPISDTITPELFYKQIRSKRTNIKKALLDQSIISGLGNIYATDALFMARVNPYTQTEDINLETAIKLLETSRQELLEGILHRGSTLDDKMYIDAFGKEGSHQNHFKIYSKALCPSCSSDVVFSKLNGRGTYHCPVCQPLGNQKRLL